MTMHILIADDEQAARFGLTRALASLDCRITEATDGKEALDAIRCERPHLAFLDLDMPEMTGEQVLDALAGDTEGTEIVVVTADDSLESAVNCVRKGAADYLTKPYEVERLRAIARRTQQRLQLEGRVEELSARLDQHTAFGALVGTSRPMQELYARIERTAAAPLNVLVRGETGTGKELIAREVHRRSPQANAPFVAVNVAAVTESLAESELFGHRKGAFTGATADRVGCFEEANGGTLFLDEIGDMPAGLQAKILRALQDGEVQPVGSSDLVPANARVICATHQDLEALMDDGAFRRDLFFRIKGIDVRVPPLRDRQEDILVLADHFLTRYAERAGTPPLKLGPGAAARLLTHPWPGNVRELAQLVQSAAALAEDAVVSVDDLGLEPTAAPESIPDLDALSDLPLTEAKQRLVTWFEERSIRSALDASSGNISHAARKLGIHRQSLQQKMSQLGIRP